MRAIIMAGGFGTRLRPLTINTPKPMVPIGNTPMMEHVLSLLIRHGITDVTALLYFQPDKIKEYFGDGHDYGINLKYVIPEEDYGTAGAVRYALAANDEPVLVISGDLVTDFDLSEAMAWHKEKQSEATILLTRMQNPLAYGIVLTDKNGGIIRFLEKPTWGEAFSDTINTGIYILEPTAVNLIPQNKAYDFSQDLYPAMLEKRMGLYGKIMSGYWRDVGNVDEYHRVHLDLFDGKVDLKFRWDSSESDRAEIIKGANVVIGQDVDLTGLILLGNDVTIGPGSKLHNCVIGDRTGLGAGCRIKNSIVWADNVIGDKSVMNRAIVCYRSRIGQNVQLLDNVIVSDECAIGTSATVKANCRIWPGKTVDPGATVSSSMVWGDRWNRELFTSEKITGLALLEITPEMAVRVGAAVGAFLGQGSSILTSRDGSDNSRLLKRALISGLLAAGVNVSDLEALPVPVMRFALNRGEYGGGIYIRHNPVDYRLIDLIFYDGNGTDMPTAKLKKIERLYFSEDFERASLDNIGHLDQPQGVIEDYRREFLTGIDSSAIQRAGFKVVIDHSNGASSQIFPTIFFKLGISAIELNGSLNPRKFSTSPEENAQATVQLSAIVKSLKGDIGFILNSAAEKLTVVDECGQPMDSQMLLLIVLDLFCRTHRAEKIAVPVSASMGVEQIAEEYSVEVVRIPTNHFAMIDAYRRGQVDFVGGTRGGFIFPGFQLGSDAVLTVIKILEMMAHTKARFGDLREKFEKYNRKSLSVPCPWAKKGTVMRRLLTESEDKERQLIDGVKIFENGGWVLLAPDQTTASFNILVESTSSGETSALANRYRELVEDFQAG